MGRDAGGLLLREVEKRTGIVERFAACFTDYREAERVEHTVRELVAQRGARPVAGARITPPSRAASAHQLMSFGS